MLKKIIFAAIIITPLYIILSFFSDSDTGIGTGTLVTEIFDKYDQNKDGVINVYEETFIRKETSSEDLEKKGEVIVKTESRGMIFFDADSLGKIDKRVTKEELFKLIDKFDEDNNAEIVPCTSLFFDCKGELDKFTNKYEERSKYEIKKK